MNKYLLFCICFLSIGFLYAQNSASIKGRVVDINNKPIDFATVYLNKSVNTSLVNYTISDSNGDYNLGIPSIKESTVFIITADGYKDHVKYYDKIESSIFIEPIILEKKEAKELDEIVITTNVAPIKIKKDTLEFNASSFDVRPDATVKSLLEQLPGVVVSDNGKIMVNGQEVKELLINGKPFFDNNGQIILNNLPANIINKIQVTDYKTKEQKLANDSTTSQDKAINLTIDEDKNKGFFGNVTAGGGTDERYESSLLLNYFNNDTKISVLAASNNINSLGFSNNEIFDNLVSGRNISFSQSNTGSLSINDFKLGGDKGIFTNKLVGFNYNDSFNKKVDLATNYIFNRVDFTNDYKTRTENLVPGNIYVTEANGSEKSISKSQTGSVFLEVKMGKNTTLQIDPKIEYIELTNNKNDISTTYDDGNVLVNSQKSTLKSHAEQKNIGADIGLTHKFNKANRNFVAKFSANLKKDKLANTNKSENEFLQTNTSDNRNQQLNSIKNTNTVLLSARYKEPIAINQELTIGAAYTNTFYDWDRTAFNFNSINQLYSINDPNLSFTNSMQVNEVKPNFGYRYNFKKGYLNIQASSKITNYSIKNSFLGQDFLKKSINVLPDFSFTYNFQLNKLRKMTFVYNYAEAINSFNYLAPVVDTSNPMLTVIGNPNLENTEKHNFRLHSYTYNEETKGGTYLNAFYNLNSKGVINKMSYDSNFKGTLTYLSANAGHSAYFNYGVYKNLKINSNNSLKYEYFLGFGLEKNYGITNDQKFTSNWFSIYPDVSVKWKYKKDFDVKLNYEFTFHNLNYDNYTIDKTQYNNQKTTLQTTWYLLKNAFFANDVTYSYNGNIAPGFKKDFFLWNVSLGYKFYNESLIAKVKVYDLLNQNTNVRRTADATQIVDQYNTILKRYVMFSLTYKISKFGGKTKNKFNLRGDDDDE